jgi:hypothetical protein
MKRFSIANYLLPRMRDILFLLIFAAALAAGWRTLNSDGDLPRHLLMGQVIIQTHSVPQTELFSYVYAGRPYVAHEWLADVIYYLSYQALGLKGVVFLTAILISFTFFVLYSALAADHEERFLMILIILWGTAITFLHWIARPHLFTMLFLAIWLVLADHISRGKKLNFWILPAIMLLWGNIHGEFIAGFLVLIAYMAGWSWDFLFDRQSADKTVIKNLAGTFIISFVASIINPFGFRTWTTVLSYMGNRQLMSTIGETKPPDFTNPSFLIVFLMIILSILVLAFRKNKIQSGHAFLLTGFTALTLLSGRSVHVYGVVIPFVIYGPLVEIVDPLLSKKITSTIYQAEKQLKGLIWPAATMIISLTLLLSGRIGGDYFIDPKLFPVGAVQWLENNPQSGRMFNDFKWGGYIVWRLWPAQKDFIDSQSDTTGEATQLYGTVENLNPGWQDVLNRYEVKWALMPVVSPLSQELVKDGWQILYQDQTAIILRQ